MRTSRVLLAVVAVATTLAVATPVVADVPEPPLVVEGGTADGQVTLRPRTRTTLDERVTWVLANGGTDRLAFALAVRRVATDDAGAVELGAVVDEVVLATERVVLGPGESVRVAARIPADGTPDAMALVATTVDAEPETELAGLLLRSAAGRVTPSVVGADAAAGTFTVRLDADAPALVDVAVRAAAWPGIGASEQVVPGVLVPAGGRDLRIGLAGAVAGRLAVDVAVAGVGEPARASGSLWWWPPAARAGGVALGVVLVLAVLVVRRRRSRRSD